MARIRQATRFMGSSLSRPRRQGAEDFVLPKRDPAGEHSTWGEKAGLGYIDGDHERLDTNHSASVVAADKPPSSSWDWKSENAQGAAVRKCRYQCS